jgi:hypothetical protein
MQTMACSCLQTSESWSRDNLRHRFHSMCPYFAMFPETFAQQWIERLTKPGDTILDPFSGRGTTALTAILSGRHSIATDVNDVAYCLTKAKTQAPNLGQLRNRLHSLRRTFHAREWLTRAAETPPFFKIAYSPGTLSQLLFLRERLDWKESRVDCMIAALVLGSLHGESRSPSYLSNQMPRTISTKPAYSIRFWKSHHLVAPERDVFEVIYRRAEFRYESPLPPRGNSTVFHVDMRRLPSLMSQWQSPPGCVVTSPPYLDITNFEEDQWLRLWFLGGPPCPTIKRLSRDDRHSDRSMYWSFISDMWRSLGAVLAPKAHVVIRIGSRRESPKMLKSALTGCAKLSKRIVTLVSFHVSEIKNRQTRSFCPGAIGCLVETDFHFYVA